jgi:hypothetical protein
MEALLLIVSAAALAGTLVLMVIVSRLQSYVKGMGMLVMSLVVALSEVNPNVVVSKDMEDSPPT